jgi:hypothetical protein
MKTYRHKKDSEQYPIEVMQFTETNFAEIEKWSNKNNHFRTSRVRLQGDRLYIVYPVVHCGNIPKRKQQFVELYSYIAQCADCLNPLDWDHLISYYEEVSTETST